MVRRPPRAKERFVAATFLLSYLVARAAAVPIPATVNSAASGMARGHDLPLHHWQRAGAQVELARRGLQLRVALKHGGHVVGAVHVSMARRYPREEPRGEVLGHEHVALAALRKNLRLVTLLPLVALGGVAGIGIKRRMEPCQRSCRARSNPVHLARAARRQVKWCERLRDGVHSRLQRRGIQPIRAARDTRSLAREPLRRHAQEQRQPPLHVEPVVGTAESPPREQQISNVLKLVRVHGEQVEELGVLLACAIGRRGTAACSRILGVYGVDAVATTAAAGGVGAAVAGAVEFRVGVRGRRRGHHGH